MVLGSTTLEPSEIIEPMAGWQLHDDKDGTWYVVVEDIRARDLADLACRAVLDVLRPRIAGASVDAFTDFRKVITPQADAAEEELHRISATQRKGKRFLRRPSQGMNVELDASDERQWSLLSCYAPWSINVDLYDGRGVHVGTMHDCGFDISMKLSPDEAAVLTRRLGDAVHIETYATWRARDSN